MDVPDSLLFLTLLSIGLGTLVAAWLTARWQRKARIFDLRIEAIRRLISQHVEWADSFQQTNPMAPVELVVKLGETVSLLLVFSPACHRAVNEYWMAVEARSRTIASSNHVRAEALQVESHNKFATLMKALVVELGMGPGAQS